MKERPPVPTWESPGLPCRLLWNLNCSLLWRLANLFPFAHGGEGRGGGRSSRRKRKKTFSPFFLLPRSAYCEEEGGGEGEESGLLGRKISFPLSGGGRKGKGPSLLPTLKSDHGKASKLNENGERRVGRASSLAKIRRREGDFMGNGGVWVVTILDGRKEVRMEERSFVSPVSPRPKRWDSIN